MAELTSCEHCGEEVTVDSDFCPHCGYLFEGTGPVECETHGSVEAIGVCIICHRSVCGECGTAVGSRLFCDAHKHLVVIQDWVKIVESTDVYKAEMAKSLLEDNGVHVQPQNFGSVGFVWDGGGELPLARKQLGQPAKIFVPIPEYEKALEVLSDWESSNSQSTGSVS